jgi:anti-sigma factor RsiW
MNCPLQTQDTTELLIDYTAGRLDAAKTASLRLHIETCSACADFSAKQAAVWHALDAWDPTPVSMDFNRRLWQRVDAAAADPWYRKIYDSARFSNWQPAFPLLAAILLMAAGFLLDHRAEKAHVPGVSGFEADQVEETLDDIQLLHQFDSIAVPRGGNSKSM